MAPSTSIPTTTDISEASAIGGSMKIMKEEDTIRISGCNPNEIRSNQLRSQLQHSIDLDIDIQCYFEVNADVLQSQVKKNSMIILGALTSPCDQYGAPVTFQALININWEEQ